jgi:hypothetical protein
MEEIPKNLEARTHGEPHGGLGVELPGVEIVI